MYVSRVRRAPKVDVHCSAGGLLAVHCAGIVKPCKARCVPLKMHDKEALKHVCSVTFAAAWCPRPFVVSIVRVPTSVTHAGRTLAKSNAGSQENGSIIARKA